MLEWLEPGLVGYSAETVESIITGSEAYKKEVTMINGVAVSEDGMDPWFAAITIGIVAIAHIVAANLMWFWWMPSNIEKWSAFYWTFFSAYLGVMIAYTVPAVLWFSVFTGGDTIQWVFMIFSMGSVGGPMLLFFMPQILMLSNMVVGWKSGYLVDWNSRW